MPAPIKQPSDKITKLKLHLQKVKNDFSRENEDLRDWLKDRNINIEQFSYPKRIEQAQIEIIPESVDKKVIETIETNPKPKDKELLESVSMDEYQSIMDKVSELLTFPAGQLEEESELYLEQQLSDILGFEVLAELEGIRLSHNTGVMQAEPHLKRSLNDTLEDHDDYHEAGMSNIRSAFGWFSANSHATNEESDREKYYISIPLFYYPTWNENYHNLKIWYKYRKIVVINSAEKIAVVGVVGNIGPNTTLKYQFGGSPELIRKGKIWSQRSVGKVLILFVDDPKNIIPLGPIYFDKLFNKK